MDLSDNCSQHGGKSEVCDKANNVIQGINCSGNTGQLAITNSLKHKLSDFGKFLILINTWPDLIEASHQHYCYDRAF